MKKYEIIEEANRCLLCENPICSASCKYKDDPARGLRAIKFNNMDLAKNYFGNNCKKCSEPCTKKCIKYNKINIKGIGMSLPNNKIIDKDLSIDFLGVKCENPFFLSSSVVASSYEMVSRAFDYGWAGCVYKTISYYISEEVSPRYDAINKENKDIIGFRNMEQLSDVSIEENMKIFRKLKENYPNKVLVASIMGRNNEEWEKLARLCEENGADMIECNFSCPNMKQKGLGSDICDDKNLVKEYCESTRKGTNLPILAKLSPNISNYNEITTYALEGGASGISAINTIKSITIGEDAYVSGKISASGYSGKAVKPIALRIINDIIKNHENIVHISGIGGIETWEDAIDYLGIGCENVQVTTSIMQYGYRIVEDLILGLKKFLHDNKYNKLSEFIGSYQKNIIPLENLDRNTITYPIINKDLCIKCGRCFRSCQDGGHSAITLDENNNPKVNAKNCVGCHLCKLVCPTNAITSGKPINKNILKGNH